ncbi:M13 family metallopeptidase [Bdellovibrio sp. HCB2-146]|uniref:M13 family metallopeptidase n=1 Tax=Bdellovibrio sp. HCB2-146 TaxID=3394362 RepID=UPI0039BCC3AD
MFKLSLFIVAGFVSLSANAAKTQKPSSDIPEKREFPLNPKVNACEDFHKYVCSEVEASFKLRPDRSYHDFAFSDSNERILEAKKKFMKGLPSAKGLDARTQQVKDFYLSCMNAPAKAKSEKAYVTRFAREINALSSVQELVAYSNKHLATGESLFVNLWPQNNQDNSDKMDAGIGARFMLLPDHKYYEDAKLMKDFKELLITFLQSVEPGIKKSVAEKRAQDMIDQQKEYIKNYPIANVRRQRWSEKRNFSQADLIKKYPLQQLKDVFVHIPNETSVNLPIPETLDFTEKDLTTRPLQVWKDLYLYSNLDNVMDDAYQKYFKAAFKFNKVYFGGPEKRPDRQERCTVQATNYFTKEMDAALVDKLFPNFDESKVQEVASRIRTSIADGIKANKWLSKDARKEALNKIEKARLQLVKPHNDREWDFVPQRTYDPSDYIKNMYTYADASWEKSMKEIREPANKDAWGMGPLTVNAYYNPSENKFVLPIGILQFPFYDKDGSVIENLGAVGAVIGHELGHSVDDQGSKYDHTGRLNQWMTMKDLAEFSKRGEKMIDQFNKAEHDGKLTLGENVADLVGLSFGYNAAFPKNEGKIEDKKTFFVAYARLWCQVVRPELEARLRKTDPHASGPARINEQVKHQPGFSEAFSCKPGDKMSLPESERIQIW